MLFKFFLPYLTLCHLASWGLAQNLEGLGLFTYLNSQPMKVGDEVFYPMNLDPTAGVASLAVLLTGILFVIFLLNIRASFYLNKWAGCISLISWALPGLLNMFGYMPDVRGIGPDVFRFGSGFPGSTESAAANLSMCLVGGWSAILLIGSCWNKNTFKNAYDHVWYTLGLIAALYFVVDAGLSSYRDDLTDVDGHAVRTLQLFATAQKRLEVLCAEPETTKLSPDLCALSPELKWSVSSYLDMRGNLRAKIDPPDWAVKLAGDPNLGRQVDALNDWACTQGQRPAQCQKIPDETALSLHDMDTALAFPPPRYANAIQRFHASMEKSDHRIEEIERGHNLRYFSFLAVAILAGGKLANASRAMVEDDSVGSPSWVLTAIRVVWKTTEALAKSSTTLAARAYSYLIQSAAVLLGRVRAVRSASLQQRKETSPKQE